MTRSQAQQRAIVALSITVYLVLVGVALPAVLFAAYGGYMARLGFGDGGPPACP